MFNNIYCFGLIMQMQLDFGELLDPHARQFFMACFWQQWNVISAGSDLGISLGSPQLLATTILPSVSMNF